MQWIFVLSACLIVATHTHDARAADSSRLAIAGGSLTEIVYFLGAEERIVATDSTSNFPEAARLFPSIGYVRNLSSEGLLSLQPTLILGEQDMGPPEVLAQITRIGVDIVLVPERHTAQGIVDKVRYVARVLNLQSIAEELIETQLVPLVTALERRLENADARRPPRVALLLGLQDGAPLAAGRTTSGAGLLTMAGADNVFADITGWKPVSLESMASANPEVIVIPERGVTSAGGIEAIIANPAIRLTTAGRSKNIVVMDGMAMLGFGPRTLEAALRLVCALPSDDSTMIHPSSVATQ